MLGGGIRAEGGTGSVVPVRVGKRKVVHLMFSPTDSAFSLLQQLGISVTEGYEFTCKEPVIKRGRSFILRTTGTYKGLPTWIVRPTVEGAGQPLPTEPVLEIIDLNDPNWDPDIKCPHVNI